MKVLNALLLLYLAINNLILTDKLKIIELVIFLKIFLHFIEFS